MTCTLSVVSCWFVSRAASRGSSAPVTTRKTQYIAVHASALHHHSDFGRDPHRSPPHIHAQGTTSTPILAYTHTRQQIFCRSNAGGGPMDCLARPHACRGAPAPDPGPGLPHSYSIPDRNSRALIFLVCTRMWCFPEDLHIAPVLGHQKSCFT